MGMMKAVLVTGASTGIGRKITEHLAAEGCFVYAGARKESDIRELDAIENVQGLWLDVTNAQEIAAAVEEVKSGGRGLYGLVNNAGVGTMGSVIAGNDAEFDLAMAVNVRGAYSITKAFLPQIIVEKGRIVMIGSISGILAQENLSTYSMSKHAVEAFADSLALEVAPFGVWVSVIEPGDFKTEIVSNAIKRVGPDPLLPDQSSCRDPDDVAAVVAMALLGSKPRRRYLVVSNQNEAELTIKKQIEQLVQLNEGHAYTYDREALVAALDDALAKSRPRGADAF